MVQACAFLSFVKLSKEQAFNMYMTLCPLQTVSLTKGRKSVMYYTLHRVSLRLADIFFWLNWRALWDNLGTFEYWCEQKARANSLRNYSDDD